VIELNRDLMVLEEELLFPASTQVAVFVSMDVGKLFDLDSVQVKLDDKQVAAYLYTPSEVQALHRGGVQRVYLGNLKAGSHELVAFFTGGGPHRRDYKRGTTVKSTRDDRNTSNCGSRIDGQAATGVRRQDLARPLTLRGSGQVEKMMWDLLPRSACLAQRAGYGLCVGWHWRRPHGLSCQRRPRRRPCGQGSVLRRQPLYFFQQRYFTSITDLMTSQHFSRLPHHAEEAELLRGGCICRMGLHREAGGDLRAADREKRDAAGAAIVPGTTWQRSATSAICRVRPKRHWTMWAATCRRSSRKTGRCCRPTC